MTVLLWWLIPLVATLLALAWVAVRNRPSRPVDAEQGMADLARFRHAMDKPLPSGPRTPGRRGPLEVEGDAAVGFGAVEGGTAPQAPLTQEPFDQERADDEAPQASHRRSA